jgi:hypothetical protein
MVCSSVISGAEDLLSFLLELGRAFGTVPDVRK